MKQKLYPFCVFLFILSLPLSVFAQQFSLLKDIHSGSNGSEGYGFVVINGVLFLAPNDGIHGRELWKTDGTEAGTVMIKDINPGANGSVPQSFANVNGVLFFTTDDGIHGRELWKSDGTEAGTVLIKDIKPGPAGSGPSSFYSINGLLIFSAYDANGVELWKSDGTEAGTVMVKDIFPGMATSQLTGPYPQNGSPSDLTLMNGFIYFEASDASGKNLWKTDGTEAGTILVKDVSATSFPLYNFINVNDVLYFTIYKGTETELWKSDGTETGTVLVKVIRYVVNIQPTALNGSLYFLNGGLCKSDGTEAGTVMLKNINYSSPYAPELLISINDLLYFTGYDAVNGLELWKSDGTAAGTVMVKDINPGISDSKINCFSKIGNKLMFMADDGVHGNEIWVSDGTENGTKLVQDIEPGSGNSQPVSGGRLSGGVIEMNGKLFTGAITTTWGMELWVTGIASEIGLPLTFLEFKGSIVNNDGLLQWKTGNEENTNAFVVERSIPGGNYQAIGSVAAANSPGVHQYNFTDADIASLGAPVIHYRLKQTDIDGRFTYSNIVTLAVDNSNSFVMLYPNPVKNKINLTINVSQKEKMQWQLVDNTGRIVKQGMYDLSAGSTAVTLDIPNLSSGIYFMQLNGSTLQKVIKVIKQ